MNIGSSPRLLKDESLTLASASYAHAQSSSGPCSTTHPACPGDMFGHLMQSGYSWSEELIKALMAQSKEIAALKLAVEEQKEMLASQGSMLATLEETVDKQEVMLGYQEQMFDDVKKSYLSQTRMFTVLTGDLKKGQEALSALDDRVGSYEKALENNQQSLDKVANLRLSDLLKGAFGK